MVAFQRNIVQIDHIVVGLKAFGGPDKAIKIHRGCFIGWGRGPAGYNWGIVLGEGGYDPPAGYNYQLESCYFRIFLNYIHPAPSGNRKPRKNQPKHRAKGKNTQL